MYNKKKSKKPAKNKKIEKEVDSTSHREIKIETKADSTDPFNQNKEEKKQEPVKLASKPKPKEDIRPNADQVIRIRDIEDMCARLAVHGSKLMNPDAKGAIEAFKEHLEKAKYYATQGIMLK